MEFVNPQVIRVGHAPEDVYVDAEGRVYTGVEDGRLLRVSQGGELVEVIANLPNRPLGVERLSEDELLVCCTDGGLVAVEIASGASRTLVDSVDGVRMLLCNNAAVASDGTIYFTDSSTRYGLARYRADLLMRTATGRLLKRAPSGELTVLLGGLEFANGVALAADESYVVVAETGACRAHRVWLTGARAGTSEIFVDDLWGYPDNASTGTDGLIWIAIPSKRVPMLDLAHKLPRVVRWLLDKLPETKATGMTPTVSVIACDESGAIVKEYVGEIPGFRSLTGVREHDGTLYLGGLEMDAIATALA